MTLNMQASKKHSTAEEVVGGWVGGGGGAWRCRLTGLLLILPDPSKAKRRQAGLAMWRCCAEQAACVIGAAAKDSVESEPP